jgi:hypothetical protein
MRRLQIFLSAVLIVSFCAFGQYKGKYEGWSTGYFFTGSLSAGCYQAFTHIVDFGVTCSSSGTTTGNGRGSSFVTTCHTNNCKAMLCIGGAGSSPAFSSACSTPAGITKLVKSIISTAKASGYDGVDLDWEEGEENGFDDNASKVAMFVAFHKELRDSVDKTNPKMLFTAAVTFDWYPKGSIGVAPYVDQANSMTYYNSVTDLPNNILGPNQIGATPKSKVGVGFGWGTDNEITDPNDILAKCRYAIDNGFGGVMAWTIARATTVTPWILDSISRYVTHSATSVVSAAQQAPFFGTRLLVRCDRAAGANVITVEGISSVNGTPSELAMFDPRGRLVATLFQGSAASGTYSVPLGRNVPTGTYVFRVSTPSGSYSTRASVVR